MENKNIHVLPTDKPSRLQKNRHNKLFLSEESKFYSDCINQNIYITSDEEIKEDDWGLSNLNEIILFGRSYNEKFYKKIILTDDKDLIKDGVQAIDDEFLEWFVKNPSCEEVDVNKSYGGTYYITYPYKIIIPKEESNYNMKQEILAEMEKQETLEEDCPCTDECLGYLTKTCKGIEEETKQDALNHFLSTSNVFVKDSHKWNFPKEELKQKETFKEVAERILLETVIDGNNSFDLDKDLIIKEDIIKAMIQIIKWQQEQILDFLYSEITERRDYSASKMCEKVVEFIEQFKNKTL